MAKDLTLRKAALQHMKKATRSPIKFRPNGKLQYSATKGRGVTICSDYSGSMSGSKERALKDTVAEVSQTYPEAEHIGFASGEADYYDASIVDQLECAGGTPMMKALQLAYSGNPESVVLITDGYPDDYEDDILNLAREQAVPIYPIGIGEGGINFNEKFLKELARITGGKYQNVKEGELLKLTGAVTEALQIEHKTGGGTIAL